MKRIWTGGAILYEALATIFSFRDLALRVRTDSGDEHPMQVTNAAILKNPHVSGNLRFPGEPAYDSGTFRFHVASRLGVPGRIRLLVSLMRGRLWCDRRLEAFEGHCAELRSATPFDVECDRRGDTHQRGEVLHPPRALRVCTC